MAEIGLEESDLVETFVRGSGPGGQKVNKSSIAVQLKHQPSGLEVKVHERSRMRIGSARRALCDLYCEKVLGQGTKQLGKRLRRKNKVRRKRRSRSGQAVGRISRAHQRAARGLYRRI